MGALAKRLIERQIELDESIKTIVDRARNAGEPIHKATIYKYMNDEGAKRPPEHTIRSLAVAFGLSEAELRRYAGMPSGDSGPWLPPEESARLSRDQRRALDHLIKAIVKSVEIVTEPLTDVVQPGLNNEISREVAPGQQVGETRASRRRTPGPGAHQRTPKDAKHAATAPDANKDADV